MVTNPHFAVGDDERCRCGANEHLWGGEISSPVLPPDAGVPRRLSASAGRRKTWPVRGMASLLSQSRIFRQEIQHAAAVETERDLGRGNPAVVAAHIHGRPPGDRDRRGRSQ